MSGPNDFRRQIEKQRPYLMRFATLQLRDADAVEDVVQETLLAALAGEARFAGQSSLRTWLTGILKHKLIDTIRRASRERERFAEQSGEDDAFETLFEQNGHWVEHPAAWRDPDASLEQKQFYAALERCLKTLPKKTAQVFMMREHLGVETDEICREFSMTPNHCGVLIYRARMALQLCLDTNWFAKK